MNTVARDYVLFGRQLVKAVSKMKTAAFADDRTYRTSGPEAAARARHMEAGWDEAMRAFYDVLEKLEKVGVA